MAEIGTIRIKDNIEPCEMDLCKNKKWDGNGKNVLLLSMSTLNGNGTSFNKYFAKSMEGEYYPFTAVSQLEPGTKYIMTKLAKQKKKLDEIIIIATPETRRKTEKKDRKGNVTDTYPSAIGQYLYGLNQFVSGCAYPVELTDLTNALGSCNSEPLDFSIYEAMNDMVAPSVDMLFDDNVYQLGNCSITVINEGDEDVLNQITHELLEKTNDGYVNLFVDVQGGRRTFFYTMFCTTTLLRDKAINLVELFATDFDTNYDAHPVVEYTKEYAVLDLVSGIRTFSAYGKSKELNVFLKNRDIEKNTIESDLIDNLRKIDQSLSINDPNGIEKQLNILRNSPLITGEMPIDEVDPQFALIIDDIKRTYGSLLDKVSSEEGTNYVDLIKWLANKDFITQALTMVEDKLPGELIDTIKPGEISKKLKKCVWVVETTGKLDWGNNSSITYQIGKGAQPYYKPENNVLNGLLYNVRIDAYRKTIIKQVVYDMWNVCDLHVKLNFNSKSKVSDKYYELILNYNINSKADVTHNKQAQKAMMKYWENLLFNLLTAGTKDYEKYADEIVFLCTSYFNPTGVKKQIAQTGKLDEKKYEVFRFVLYCVYGVLPNQLDAEKRKYYDFIKSNDDSSNCVSALYDSFERREIATLSDEELSAYAHAFALKKEKNDSINKKIKDRSFGIDNEKIYTIVPQIRSALAERFVMFDGEFGKTYASLKNQNRTEKGFIIKLNEKKKDCIALLEAILLLYRSLKNERNTTNHASEDVHMEYEHTKMGILILAEMIDRVQKS